MAKKVSDWHLPQDVLVEILERLPVKSLLRLRCVSKSWCSLISNPDFITTHVNRNINKTHTLVRYSSEIHKTEHYKLYNDNDEFDVYTELEFPFRKFNMYLRIVGSCNGLICLGNDLVSYASDLVLWNPSIRKFVKLPTPSITFASHGAFMLVLGFGFDSKSSDYKVVRIVYLQGGNGFNKIPPEVELYELSTSSWRSINADAPPYEICNYSLQANMNGAVHWIAFNTAKAGGFRSLIVAFDFSDEVFKEIRLPSSLIYEYPLDISIAACGELLSLFQYYQGSLSRCCSVWVMEEYGVFKSWSKIFNIDLLQGVGTVLGSRKNGELLVVTEDGELISYDPDDHQVKDLGIRGSSLTLVMRTCSLYVNTYVESLVLLAGAHGVLGYGAAPALLGEQDDGIEERE